MGQALREYTDDHVNLGIKVINDHPRFCSEVLKVGSKSGKVIPLVHNRTQRELLKLRDKQLKETGRVRIAIVKARRHGVSTEVAALGYNNTLKAHIKREKYNTFILAHREDTAVALFDIVKLYHTHSDDFQPKLKSCSKTDMVFDGSGCTYQTATAASSDVGRGMTAHFVHVSEIAHIKHAEKIAAGLIEAVGDEDGTEIYFETTANGEGGYFHNLYLRAKRGDNDFAPFFAPWFWDDGCQRDVPDGFKLTKEEQAYKELYNLTDRQMVWKRAKEGVQGLTEKEGKLMFKQEYPANDKEAFQFSSVESFIPVDSVIRAMNQEPYPSFGAIIASLDPSECTGNDEDAFGYRQGFNLWGFEYKRFDGIPQQVAFCKEKLDKKVPYIDLFVIDAGGGGRQIKQILDKDGYGDRVRIVNYGAAADNEDMFKNKKAEMSYRCREALLNDTSPPSYEDNDKLKSEMIIEGSNQFEGLDGKLEMEKKKSLISRGYKSPNGYDMIRQLYAFKFKRNHFQGSHDVSRDPECKLWFEDN